MSNKLIDNKVLKAQWHPRKNNHLNINTITIGSEKRVWWLCEKNAEHEWETSVNGRHHGKTGCPFCSGKKREIGQTFAKVHPALLKYWDHKKNADINPYETFPPVNTKIWWVCSNKHSYQNTIKQRLKTNKQGCPYCYGKLVSKENSLSENFPNLLSEWNWTKNKKSPSEYTKSSGKSVWWICPRGHEYRAPIDRRTINESTCRQCKNHISIPHARIYSELKPIFSKARIHAKLEGYEVDIFIPELDLVLEYDGQFFHKDRLVKDLKKTKKLQKKYRVIRIREPELPHIRTETVTVDVGLKPTDIVRILKQISSSKSALFEKKLEKDGFQNTELFLQVIAEKFVSEENSLELHPRIVAEWDTQKNAPLLPINFTQKSNFIAHWICSEGHSWEASINNRVGKGSGCPYCIGRKATKDNNFQTLHPDLLKFWDYDNNSYLPQELLPQSNVKINWVCENKHKFSRLLSDVTNKGLGCPYCSGRYSSEQNNLSSDEQSREWFDYDSNHPLIPENFTLKSGRDVHWKCPIGHKFVKSVYNFRKAVNKCPTCFTVGTKYTFIRDDGEKFSGTQSEFCNEYSLTQSGVSALTRGRQKSHKGWSIFSTEPT